MTDVNVFIIPGNPPALYFYQLWAEEIQKQHPECSLCLSPYPNLPTGKDPLQYLHDVADLHGQKLTSFQQAAQQKVTVIGHSLGGWMALRLLEQHNSLIENCFLLYPFLRRPSLKGRAILRSLYYLYRVSFMKNLLLSYRSVLEKLFKDLQYVSDEELQASLTLAYHEHQVISPYEGTLKIPKSFREKLHMIYCDQDTWCPSPTVHEMKQWISCEKMNTTHGFITSYQERKRVWEALSIRSLKKSRRFE